MTREEALVRIADGHSVYAQAYADEVCDALGIPHLKGEPMYSDPPGTFKGLKMKDGAEGEVCVSALQLGSHAVDFYRLDHMEFFGRGSQAREFAQVLKEHFAKEGVA